MEIRKSIKEDLPRIVEIFNQAVNEGAITTELDEVTVAEKLSWFAHHDAPRHPLLVIEDDDGIAGWCSLQPWQPGHAALAGAVLLNLFVDQNKQRRGLGAALLGNTLERATAAGVTHVIVFLLEGNRPAVQLLNKFGFKIWGHLPEIADFGPIYCGQHIYGRVLKSRTVTSDVIR